MGFFSWHTNDTDRSIANRYSNHKTFTVYMHDNKGNVWIEKAYDGYGRFGGKDYYELLSEMNNLGSSRETGIWLQFEANQKDVIYPALFEHSTSTWESYQGQKSPSCPDQGYFYDDDDDDDDEEDEDNGYPPGWW